MATRSEKGMSRLLTKLETRVSSGEYYEAHQLYRTLYFRYLSQKKYDEILHLLSKGAGLLLEHDQQGSGADLAILLIDVLTKSSTKPTEEWITRLAFLFELMKENIPEKDTFLMNSIKWSMDNSHKGHPLLHKKIAEAYWKQKKYTLAHKHFLHSCGGETYANMLIELHITLGLKSEIDLIIAQAVLQLLALHNMQMALETFNNYTMTHPAINCKKLPYPEPLLNFLWFLLQAIEQKKVEQFKILNRLYAVSINRDPNYITYLETIGRVWFGIMPKSRNTHGMHKSMFKGLLNSILKEDEGSDEEETFIQASSFHNTQSKTPDLD